MSLFSSVTRWAKTKHPLMLLVYVLGLPLFIFGIPFMLYSAPKFMLFILLVFIPLINSLLFSFTAIFGPKDNPEMLVVPLAVLCWLMSLAMMAYSWEFWDHIVSKVSDTLFL